LLLIFVAVFVIKLKVQIPKRWENLIAVKPKIPMEDISKIADK
jgi:hypothetical protein